MNSKKKLKRRKRVKLRIRKKVIGTSERPRLSVFRSLAQFYGQLIDDETGATLVSASSFEKKNRDTLKKKKGTEVSREVGKILAERAIALGVKKVVFDRNAYAYHGRVKTFAEGAREAGLMF